jgi:hypothetical protein
MGDVEMGLFSGVKNTYRKSEAAVVIQNVLENQVRRGLFTSDPAMAANRLVEGVWRDKSDLFEGKFGQRPHKLSVAIAALSFAVASGPKSHPNRDGFVLAFVTLLKEVETNGRLYAFNGVDNFLLERAAEVFGKLAAEENL